MKFITSNKVFSRKGNIVPKLWIDMCLNAKYAWTACDYNKEEKKYFHFFFYADNPEQSCPAFMVFDTSIELDSFIKQFKLEDKINKFYQEGYEYQ